MTCVSLDLRRYVVYAYMMIRHGVHDFKQYFFSLEFQLLPNQSCSSCVLSS